MYFPADPRVSALFSALPTISAARRLSHSTSSKIPATNYTFFYRYFRAEYRYPHGTGIPVWTPSDKLYVRYLLATSSSGYSSTWVLTALRSSRTRLEKIEYAYWLQAGYISWPAHLSGYLLGASQSAQKLLPRVFLMAITPDRSVIVLFLLWKQINTTMKQWVVRIPKSVLFV